MNLQLVHRYILSLSKNKNMVFEEKKKNEKDQKQTGKKKNPMARDETRTSDVKGQRPLSIAPGQLTGRLALN